MPRFLAPITVDQENVTGNETISGTETILGATSGKDSFWDNLSVTGNVSAVKIVGDGASWSGYGNPTYQGAVEIVPNSSLYGQGQYIKIRPTSNFDEQHIHIEAGTYGDLVLGNDDFYYKLNGHARLEDNSTQNLAEIGVCEQTSTTTTVTDIEAGIGTGNFSLSLSTYPWANDLSVGNSINVNGEIVSITTIGSYYSYTDRRASVNFYPPLQNVVSLGDPVEFTYKLRKIYAFDSNGNFILPVSGDIKDGNGVSLLSGIPLWDSTYSTVCASSAQWSVSNDITKLPLSGGTIDGDLLINGSLTALSGATFINTIFQDTSALRIYNSGFGPALYVEQAIGTEDIAKFYDADGIEALHIGNALNPESAGVIGIKTSTPNKTLTVNGEISANNAIWASAYHGDGSDLTSLNASNISSGTLSAARLPAFNGDITTTVNTSVSTTVVKLQGHPISTATPSNGQILQWNGTAWVPGSVATGGSGGGGVFYYFDYANYTGISPTAGLPTSPVAPSLLGREYSVGSSSLQTAELTEGAYTRVAGFVTLSSEPAVTNIPAGLWDFNFWINVVGGSGQANQTQIKVVVHKYDSSTSTYTSLASSDDVYIYDPITVAQYIANVTMPQTTILSSDRIYIELYAQKNVNQSRQIRVYFDSLHPSHVHTTLPSVAGSGLVKTINGVMQTPASLLVDVDVADNAAIAQTKISGLTAALDSKFDKSGGTVNGNLTVTGTFSTVNTDKWASNHTTTSGNSGYWTTAYAAATGLPTTYLALSGGSLSDGLTAVSATFTTSVSSPALSGTHYGDGSKLTGLNASNIATGVLPISSGGTGSNTIEIAKSTLGGIQTAQIRHGSNLLLQPAGTISNATFTSGLSTVTFSSTTTTLSTGMSFNAGIITGVIKSIDSPTQVTMSVVAGSTQTITTLSAYNVNQTNLTSSSIITMDGKTMVIGDVVILAAQTANAQNGPWVLNSLAGNVMSFIRPSYWTGTIYGASLFYIQQGAGNFGLIVSVAGAVSTGSIVGIDSFSAYSIGSRASNAINVANTFTGKQTFQPGSTGSGAVPFAFQAGVLMTTPQAHSVEWDGSILYTTTNAPLRTAQAAFVAGPTNTGGTVPTSSGSGGINGMMAYDANFLYICVGSNTWRRVPLNTF